MLMLDVGKLLVGARLSAPIISAKKDSLINIFSRKYLIALFAVQVFEVGPDLQEKKGNKLVMTNIFKLKEVVCILGD